MASLRVRTVLIILGLLFPLPQSFVIRKRSIGYDFLKDSKAVPSDDWLPERPIDQMLLDPYSRGIYMADGPERMALDFVVPRPDDDYYLNDLDGDDERSFDAGRGPSLTPDRVDYGEGEVDEGPAKLLNKSELESLFEKDSDRKKKLSTGKAAERTGMTSSSKSELRKEDVEKLLNPESKSELHKVVTETKVLMGVSNGSNTPPSYEGVRVVEVTEKEPNGETRKQKQTQWLLSPDLKQKVLDKTSGDHLDPSLERTWLGSDEDDSGPEADEQRVTHKVKRSELSTAEDAEDFDDEEETSEADQDDVELLKTYIRLQTEENRHLEQALNLAITTQVENSDAYLGDEINHLRMAYENEEALESIRRAIRRRQQRAGNGQDGQETADDENLGETDAVDDDTGGDNDDDDDDDDEFSNRLIKAKLKKFLIDSAVNDLKKNVYEDEIDGEGGGGEEEEEEEEEDLEQDQRSPHLFPNAAKVLNPFTRNAYDEYGKPKRNDEYDGLIRSADDDVMQRDANVVDITDLLDTPASTETGYCSAVRELSDDCLAARSEGLVLDAEAASLCNRHQICYLCGSVFGMTRDTCDRGFLGESEQLCSGKEECSREAAGLYLIMAKSHRFIATSVALGSYDVCASRCVYDYIVGETDDRQ